jgi:hypothetical protein
MNSDSAIFCFGKENEFLRRKQKAQRWHKNTFLRRLCTLRKDGIRIFAQIKACAVHKAQVLRCTASKATLLTIFCLCSPIAKNPAYRYTRGV